MDFELCLDKRGIPGGQAHKFGTILVPLRPFGIAGAHVAQKPDKSRKRRPGSPRRHGKSPRARTTHTLSGPHTLGTGSHGFAHLTGPLRPFQEGRHGPNREVQLSTRRDQRACGKEPKITRGSIGALDCRSIIRHKSS
ncbi:hypothetical protein Ddc_17630 [Ditylenchus destructor]|nr:hypothetical protein Ddc_17630 [Ditylenchus destructor]